MNRSRFDVKWGETTGGGNMEMCDVSDITIKHNLDVLLTGQRPAGLQSFNVCYKWGCIC